MNVIVAAAYSLRRIKTIGLTSNQYQGLGNETEHDTARQTYIAWKDSKYRIVHIVK